MKKCYAILFILFSVTILLAGPGVANAQPRISNCDISPKEIGYKTEVTISFDYENVEGGLKEAKVILTQMIQLPDEEKAVTRISNWQAQLIDLSAYPAESGRFEKKFVNADLWRGPKIELTYEIKVIDKKGIETNICATKIMPK